MSTTDSIELIAGSLGVTYDRSTGDWSVSCDGYSEVVRGIGLAEYRQLLDALAAHRSNPNPDVEFLRDLGGHEHEVAA